MQTIKTTYENLNIGEIVRLFLEIDDLIDGSGNPIHVDQIYKVSIEKLNNSHIDPTAANKITKAFYGPRNVKLSIPNPPEVLNFLRFTIPSSEGNRIVRLDTGEYFVKIISPELIKGIYRIEDVPIDEFDDANQPIGKTLIISGVFASLEEAVYFQILDPDLDPVFLYTNFSDPGATLEFNESVNLSSPVWKKDLAVFEDMSGSEDFSVFQDTISNFTIQVSESPVLSGDNVSEYKISMLSGDGTNAFTIIGFENNEKTDGISPLYWNLLDDNGDIVSSGSSGKIFPQYYSPVHSEEFINSEGVLLNRYFLDWKIEDNFQGGEGSYIAYFHVRRNGRRELFYIKLLIHNDFLIPEILNKKFQRENFHELLRSYLPFFYTDYGADDVLKQTLQAFGESIYDFVFSADQFVQIIDPARTPLKFLPYIGNLFSYNLKGDSPVDWRQQLVNLPLVLKKKGTLDSLISILDLMGNDVLSVIFYWQVKSFYLWEDYFFLENDNSLESFQPLLSPLCQRTGINQVPDYSRYQIQYFSQEKNKWFNLVWSRIDEDGETAENQDFLDVIRLSLVQERPRTQIFDRKFEWNWQNQEVNQFFIVHNENGGSNDIKNIDLNSDVFISNFSSFSVRLISGQVQLGLYSIKSVIIDSSDSRNNMIEVQYSGTESSVIDDGAGGAPITFVIFKDGVQSNFDPSFANFSGLFQVQKRRPFSIKDSFGRLRGKDLNASDEDFPETFNPQFNDVLKIRYQYKEYPYEINPSCPNFQIGFDESEICKDNFVLSLPLADQRSVYDDIYPDQRLLPPVNFNVRLMPDSNCFVKSQEDFCGLECLETADRSLRTFDICDICTKRNPLEEPIIYGFIRTKFPWSENVYNMDEYDGSTRPSYVPCDIDENFLDKCGCCWSSFFSISVAVKNMSDRTISAVNEAIEEFKPFHSRLHTLSLVGKIEEHIHVDDNQADFEIRFRNEEHLELGYYPFNKRRNVSRQPLRSETFFFAEDEFYTSVSDMKIYLRDFNVIFDELEIGVKEADTGSLLLPTQVNVNYSRVVIESPEGIHANKTYNISETRGKRITLVDALNDNGDALPVPPYSNIGPWSYTIYTRKFPDTAVSVLDPEVWPQPVNVTITKSARYVVRTDVNVLDNGIEVVSTMEDPSNVYTIQIESGQAIPGIYSVIRNNDNDMIIDYPFSVLSVGNITFSVFKDGEPIDNLSSVSGELIKEEIFGEFTYGSSDLVSDWNINVNNAFVQVNNGSYFKVDSIEESTVRFSGYALGLEGSDIPVAIFEKAVSSNTAFIEASTDIIHVNNIDFPDILNLNSIIRDRDFLVGLKINGVYRYYNIAEIFESDPMTLRLRGLSVDEIILNQPFILRIHALSDYSEDTLRPGFNEDIIILSTATSGTSSGTLVDSAKNFEDLHVHPGDIVYKFSSSVSIDDTVKEEPPLDDPSEFFTDDGWAKVASVLGDTIIFDSVLQQAGSPRSLSSGDEYRIIRRKFFDVRKMVPNVDVVKINISPIFNNVQNSVNNPVWVPMQNIAEISPGEYEIKIASQDGDKFQTIDVYKARKLIFENIIVGPIDDIDPKFLPLDLSRFRIINKDIDQAGNLVDQFVIPVFNQLSIDHSDVGVQVNNVTWNQVDRWTDPESAAGNIGRREYIVQRINDHEIHIWFGDGITGKRVNPADQIGVRYFTSGLLPGSVMPEETEVVYQDKRPDDPVLKASVSTDPVDSLTEKEYVYFVIEDINTGDKTKIYVA